MFHSFTFNSHLDSCDKDATLIASLYPDHYHSAHPSCKKEDFDLSNVKDGDVVFISCHTNVVYDPTRSRGVRAEFVFKNGSVSEDRIYSFLSGFNGRVTFILDCCKAGLFTRVKEYSCEYEFYCSSNSNSFSFDSNLLSSSVFSFLFHSLFEKKGSELVRAINLEYRRRGYRTKAEYDFSPTMK